MSGQSLTLHARPLTDREGGGWAVTCADYPGCMGDGETMAEAVADFGGALTCWLEADKRRARG